MKKLILIGAALVAISFTSCKKIWTCECTSSVTVGGQTTTSSASGKSEKKMSKKDAKSDCESKNGTTETAGVTTKLECGLK